MGFAEELAHVIYAGHGCIVVSTREQSRAVSEIVRGVSLSTNGSDKKIYLWSKTQGLAGVYSDYGERFHGTDSLQSALEYISGKDGEAPEKSVYILCFTGKELQRNEETQQAVLDAHSKILSKQSTMIFVEPEFETPPVLDGHIYRMELRLPGHEEIRAIYDRVVSIYGDKLHTYPDEDDIAKSVNNASGMTLKEAESAIYLSIAKEKKINPDIIHTEKRRAVRSVKAIEHLTVDRTMDDVGGFDVVKHHLARWAKFFKHEQEARRLKVDPPKGVLLVGVPGCGKSLFSKAAASALDIPLVRLNFGALFSSHVGDSERNARNALKALETMAPVCVQIDEIEKAMAGLGSSDASDGGTASRVIGETLTWMNETSASIYKVATCNNISKLPPELLRIGRWDHIFSVDLPTPKERIVIFNIHLKLRDLTLSEKDVKLLATKTEGFSGAEIEAVCSHVALVRFNRGGEVGVQDFILEIGAITPTLVLKRTEITLFREWAKTHTVSVSSQKKEKPILVMEGTYGSTAN